MLNKLRKNRRDGSSPADGETYLIVGLGNPGKRYERTRHNAGFMVADQLHARLPGGTSRSRFQAELYEARDGEKRVVLAKPQTFMNESGIAVSQIARWYKVPRDKLLLIYDELDVPFGSIRLRANGSAGGHNGVSSVIKHLNTPDFARLRVGISRPNNVATVPYVLSPFASDENKCLADVIDRSVEAALLWLRDGIIVAMNEHNRRIGTSGAEDNLSGTTVEAPKATIETVTDSSD